MIMPIPICSSSPSSFTAPSSSLLLPPSPPLLFLPLLSFQGESHVSEEECNGKKKKTGANVRRLRPLVAVKLWTSDLTPLRSSFLM